MDKVAEIPDLMNAGDRAYLTNDLELSAEKFSLATEYSVGAYGDFAPECFEAYFKYGRTLAAIAQLEAEDPQTEFNSVQNYLAKMTEGSKDVDMNDSRVGDPDELPDEERQEIIANVDKALEENCQQLDNIAEDGETPEVPDVDELNAAAAEDADMEEEEANGDDEEEEELPSIVLAYENLEVARKIAEKAGDSKEWELKRAEVLALIAELYLKEDKYQEAIADLQTSLELNQKHLDANDRIIASSYYELALAHNLNDDYLRASELAAKAMDILKVCIEQAKAGEEDAKKVVELEECLKDVAAAHEDYVSSHKDAEMKKAVEAKEAAKIVSPEKNEEENQQPPQDITSNIRKGKRPAEDSNEEAAKKLKVNEESEIPNDPVV